MALGEGENFFSREKAERRHRSFLLSPNPSPLFKKSGVFCKVESSPLLEIIYPYGEQSLSLKGNIYNGNISGFDGKGKFFPAGSKFLTGKEFNSIEFSALRGNKFDLCCL